MFYISTKSGQGGGKNMMAREYGTYKEALDGATELLQSPNHIEVTVFEAKAKVQRTVNVEVTTL